MNVKCANDHIRQINILCSQMNEFELRHEELSNQTEFFSDVIAFLCDYQKVLEHAIDRAELDI